jgi:hypothetical protein
MARARIRVRHLVVCDRASVTWTGPDSPYTLHEVRYVCGVPADAEYPVVVPELWLYVRFLDGTGRRSFGVDVVWIDAPGGEAETCSYPLPVVRFGPNPAVMDRAWRLNHVRFDGPGRYAVRLREGRTNRLIGTDYLELRRAP